MLTGISDFLLDGDYFLSKTIPTSATPGNTRQRIACRTLTWSVSLVVKCSERRTIVC